MNSTEARIAKLEYFKESRKPFMARTEVVTEIYAYAESGDLMMYYTKSDVWDVAPEGDVRYLEAGLVDMVEFNVDLSSTLKSSGEVREFSTGAVRDSGKGKPRLSLLPQDLLARVAILYGLGADKYGKDNWRLGQPQSDVEDSLLRHLLAYKRGKRDEDHLAAVVWNALSLLNVDEYMRDNPDVFNIFGTYPNPEPSKSATSVYADGKLFTTIEREE